MSKKYIVTTDMVDSTLSSSSTNPIQNKAVYDGLALKLNNSGYTGETGKVPMVQSDGTLAIAALPEGSQADWDQTTSTEGDYIKNKPFQTVGSGLEVVNGVLTADMSVHYQIMTELPAASSVYKNTIALILNGGSQSQNIYKEYVCVNKGSSASPDWAWEQLGNLNSTYEQTTTQITVNGTVMQSATDSQIGLMTAADHVALGQKQLTSNLVTGFQTTPDDTHYPSEKLVKDQLDLKQTTANITQSIAATASASTTKYPSEKATATALATKQDTLSWDTAPVESSTKPVTSGGLYTEFAKYEKTANKATVLTTSNDTLYPTVKAVNTALALKVDLKGSTVLGLGKDSTGYYIEE